MNNRRAFSDARQKADDEEIERLEAQHKEEVVTQEAENVSTKPDDAEEATWRERYANHRRLLSKKEEGWAKERQELLAKAEAARQTSGSVPVTKEELEDYVERYPKVGALIGQIVNERLNERMAGNDARMAKIDELEAEREYQKAKDKLASREPDFFGDANGALPDGTPAIVKREDFHKWVEKTENDPDDGWIYDAIYNSNNVGQAVAAIKMWKDETGFSSTKPKTKKSSGDAAQSVRTTGKPTLTDTSKGGYDFTESQVGSMSIREYELKEEAIDKARLSGRFLYDLSR